MKTDGLGLPMAQGLYDPSYEKDACGVGYVVSIDGVPSNKVNTHTGPFRATTLAHEC